MKQMQLQYAKYGTLVISVSRIGNYT